MALYDNKPCFCGSGEMRQPNFDGRGIFLTYTCGKCHKEKMSKYRPEVLNTRYEADDLGDEE